MVVAYTALGAEDRLKRYRGGRVSVCSCVGCPADVSRNQSNRGIVGPRGEGEHLPGPGLGEGPGPEFGPGSLLNLHALGDIGGQAWQAGARGLKEMLGMEATQPEMQPTQKAQPEAGAKAGQGGRPPSGEKRGAQGFLPAERLRGIPFLSLGFPLCKMGTTDFGPDAMGD